MNKIGIFQGRLSQSYENKIQSFPFDTWELEFELANKIGFELIEWIIGDEIDNNPLFNLKNKDKINRLKRISKIDINHICLDYLMNLSFLEKETRKIFLYIFNNIVDNFQIKNIELPMLGKSRITKNNMQEYLAFFKEIDVLLLQNNNINILIETDLKPQDISLFINNFKSKRILINYDTGNSIMWGYKEEIELNTYGDMIGSVHIKDCTKRDYSVPLGNGDVNFNNVLKLLYKKNYKYDFILQPARNGNDFMNSKNNYNFFKKKCDESFK